MKTHKIKETYEFIYNGISVFIKIDYINNKISIVKPKESGHDTFSNTFVPNHFVFADRGVEYMQGWRNVLETVSEATKDAQKRYEANLALESKFSEEFIERVGKGLLEQEKLNKKK